MSEWKYDIDDVGEDADPDPGPDDRERGPLEPGSPTAENVFFVALGVVTMLFAFARVILVAG